MADDSLFPAGAPQGLPLVYQTEMNRLGRKQAVANALAGQALQYSPTEMVGQVAVAQSPWSILGKTLTGGIAGHQARDTDRKMAALGNQYQTEKERAAQVVMQRYQTDPRGAVAMALMSKYPELQSWGQAQFKTNTKLQEQRSGEALKRGTNASVIQANNAGSDQWLQPKAGELQTVSPGTMLINKDTGLRDQTLDGAVHQQMLPNGAMANVMPDGTIEAADKAPKVQLGVTQYAQREGLGKGFEKAYEDDAKLRADLQAGQEMMGTLADMEALDRAGMYNGFGAEQTMALAKIGQQLGMDIDPSRLANAEAYRSAQVQLWQKLISKMGGNRGVTQEEAAEIKQILPRIADSPQGRARIMQILRNSQQRAAQRYNRLNLALQAAQKSEDPSLYWEENRKLIAEEAGLIPMGSLVGGGQVPPQGQTQPQQQQSSQPQPQLSPDGQDMNSPDYTIRWDQVK